MRAEGTSTVTGFREHLLDKYFGYRSRYVAYVRREAPERAGLAVASEVARLGFVCGACVLCAVILWALAAGAEQRAHGVGGFVLLFTAMALVATLLGLRAAAGAVEAYRDRRTPP